MSEYCMIEVAFGKQKEVLEVVDLLLSKRLVASCQVVESYSSWHWHYNREDSLEYLVFLKTKSELSKEIYRVIKDIHTYDCFEFAVFSLSSCNDEYLEWIDRETK